MVMIWRVDCGRNRCSSHYFYLAVRFFVLSVFMLMFILFFLDLFFFDFFDLFNSLNVAGAIWTNRLSPDTLGLDLSFYFLGLFFFL